jgi:hypothetical protein
MEFSIPKVNSNSHQLLYVIPDIVELKASEYFRKIALDQWSCKNYVDFHKALNPHYEFSTLHNNFMSDIDKISNCAEIPVNMRRLAGALKKKKKNTGKEVRPRMKYFVISN